MPGLARAGCPQELSRAVSSWVVPGPSFRLLRTKAMHGEWEFPAPRDSWLVRGSRSRFICWARGRAAGGPGGRPGMQATMQLAGDSPITAAGQRPRANPGRFLFGPSPTPMPAAHQTRAAGLH